MKYIVHRSKDQNYSKRLNLPLSEICETITMFRHASTCLDHISMVFDLTHATNASSRHVEAGQTSHSFRKFCSTVILMFTLLSPLKMSVTYQTFTSCFITMSLLCYSEKSVCPSVDTAGETFYRNHA